MKKIYRTVAIILSILTVAGCGVGCKPTGTGEPASSDAGSSELNPSTPIGEVSEYAAMFDGDKSTYWTPGKAETVTVEFSLDKETEFNSINFVEYENKITDYIVEAEIDGEYKQIYRQDEMGDRIAILDKTYTAKDLKLTATFEDDKGGICEISFDIKDKIEGTANFKNVVYYTASRLEQVRATDYTDIDYATDLIFFDYGAWDKNGDFLWGCMTGGYDEAFLAESLKEVNEVTGGKNKNGQKYNYWFCLQNYHRESTENTGELFATEKAREKLANFAVNICKKYGFVGIDIDYEYPHNSKDYTDIAWENYGKFLILLGKKMHAAGFKVSTAMYATRIQLPQEAIDSIDYVNMMTYDYNISKNMHSPYLACAKSQEYFLSIGFKPEQMLLGLPFYVKTMDGAQLAGSGYHWVIRRWRDSVKPWMNIVSNNTYTYYFNGGDMLRDKTYFAMANGYAGVFNWCNGNDVGRDDPRSLSVHIGETINRFKK